MNSEDGPGDPAPVVVNRVCLTGVDGIKEEISRKNLTPGNECSIDQLYDKYAINPAAPFPLVIGSMKGRRSPERRFLLQRSRGLAHSTRLFACPSHTEHGATLWTSSRRWRCPRWPLVSLVTRSPLKGDPSATPPCDHMGAVAVIKSTVL